MCRLIAGKSCLVFLVSFSLPIAAIFAAESSPTPSTVSTISTDPGPAYTSPSSLPTTLPYRMPVSALEIPKSHKSSDEGAVTFQVPGSETQATAQTLSAERTQSTPRYLRAAATLNLSTNFPSQVHDSGSSSQSLDFKNRGSKTGVEAGFLSAPFIARAGIQLRYHLSLGFALYRRETPLQIGTDSTLGSQTLDRQNLYLIPVPLELEASRRAAIGFSPLFTLGLVPALTLAQSSLLQDSKIGLGYLARASIGARQEFSADNALMLKLEYSYNKILKQSPNSLGFVVGYQRQL